MELEKINEVDEAVVLEEKRQSPSRTSTLNYVDAAEITSPQPPRLTYKERMKKALFWVHYIIFIVIIAVSVYSVIAGTIHPHEEAKKDHEAKISNVIQGLYKLIALVNHLPNIGPIGVNGDPLDEIGRSINKLLDNGGNLTQGA